MTAHTHCPRCGVGMASERVAAIQEGREAKSTPFNDPLSEPIHKLQPALYGVHYDHETGDYICVECGATWNEEGQHHVTTDLLGSEHAAGFCDGRASSNLEARKAVTRIDTKRTLRY